MTFLKRDHQWILIVSIFIMAMFLLPLLVFASQPCAVSPASGGVTILPNTLLIVDTSGSMLYAAYPDSYSNSTVYDGLFDPTKRYNYDSTNKYFEENESGSWSGNFLNWATITRWDVAVYVLTGQNYKDISSTRYLVSNGDNRYSDDSFTDDHWYTDNDTDDVNPYSPSDGSLRYRPVPHYYNSSLTDSRWSYLDVYDGSDHDYYSLRIKVASDYQPQGLLHDLENKVRLGLMYFNYDDGGEIQKYVQKLDSTQLSGVIDDLHKPLVDNTSNFTNSIGTTWTPLAETLYEATRYFQQVSPVFSGYTVADEDHPERDPYYYEEYGDEVWCAKSYVILVTDGEPTKDRDSSIPSSVKTADGDSCDSQPCPCEISSACATKYNCTDCDAYPFDSSNDGSAYLDDVAYYAFHTDLRPPGDNELDNDQWLSTHTVFVFGAADGVGEALLDNTAKNSGGMYRLASNATDLVDALEAMFEEITQQAAAAASTAITSEPVSGVDMIYIPYYKHPTEEQWWGNIRAFNLDDDGNLINSGGSVATDNDDDNVLDNPVWDASELLRAKVTADSREIFTSIAGSKVEFKTSTSALDKYFDVDWDGNAVEDESGEADALISYIRGADNAGGFTPSGFTFRDRANFYIGDIMHASPAFIGKPSARYDLVYGDMSYWNYCMSSTVQNRPAILYGGTNDGMLHAFDAATGEEHWAYIPSNLLPHLKWLADSDYCHCFYVDLSANVWDIKLSSGWRSVLIGGMRIGGTPIDVDTDNDGTTDTTLRSSLFALNVTNPSTNAFSVLWEKNNEKFGYTTSKPTPVKVGDSWYLVFGSGPKSRDGEGAPAAPGDGYTDNNGYIFIVDPDTGDVLREINMGAGNFFSSPVSIDYDLDYSVDMIYIGDALGNLWRIKTFTGSVTDSSKAYATTPNGWIIDIDTDNPSATNLDPLLSLGTDQPLLLRPTVTMDENGRVWIYVGTGRYFCPDDNVCCDVGNVCPPDISSCPSGACTQTEGSYGDRSKYMAVGVYDRYWDSTAGKFVLQTNSIDFTVNPNILDHRVITSGTVVGLPSTIGYAIVDYATGEIASNVDSTCQGWYFRLLEERERCLGDFLLYRGAVFFISYKPADDTSDPCSTGGVSYLYGVNYLSGTSFTEPLFDLTGEGDVDTDDMVDIGGGKIYSPGLKRLDNAFAGGSPKAKGDSLYLPLTLGKEPINPPIDSPLTGVTSWKEVLE